jgi:Xaa-Pro aminopeptidase
MTAYNTDVEARVPFQWEDREPILELDFDTQEYATRIDRLQARLAEEQLDAILIYGGDAGAECSVRYVSGFFNFWGDTLVLVPATGEPVLITNAVFHGEPMHSNIQTTWFQDVRPLLNVQSTGSPRTVTASAVEVLSEWGAKRGRIAYADARHLPARIESELRERLPHAEVVDGSAILRQLRAIKSPAELEAIRELGKITSAGMSAGLEAIDAGVTENEVAGAIVGAAVAAGAQTAACFVAAGPRSFMKNVYARAGKVIENHEFVNLDMTAKFRGYQSDMARVGVAGTPRPEHVPLFEACLAAQEAGLRVVRAGTAPWTVLQTMNAVVREHGFAEWEWNTSHGGGLELSEDPYFVPEAPPLEAGMTFYIEPMIIPTEIGTVCIEDMVIVTKDGVEVVTSSPRRTW